MRTGGFLLVVTGLVPVTPLKVATHLPSFTGWPGQARP